MALVKLWWFTREGNNTGDIFTPWMLWKLGIPYEYSQNREFIGTGSIFQQARPNTIIWGSGVHRLNDAAPWLYNIDNVLAVRGKLTYNLLHTDKKIVLGDPGILLNRIYQPKTKKKYKYGILAHSVDYEFLKKFESPEVPVYSMVVNEPDPIGWLADRINECEFIFSSSLHGLIFSHSLGIPAIHVEFTPLYSTDNFKFKDYYSILDIPYKKGELGKIEDNCLPSRECIEKIQNDLMGVFPYEVSWDTTKTS